MAGNRVSGARAALVALVLVAVVLLAGLSGCAQPNGGTVTGRIEACQALGWPDAPEYAAGTVTVLQGSVTWRSTGPGTSVQILPTTVIAEETVGENSTYSFVLPPGDYVLQAHFPPPAMIVPGMAQIAPTISIAPHAGEALHVDIPNECM